MLKKLKEQENLFLDHSITMAKDTHTENAKNDRTNKKRVSIDAAHTATAATKPSLLQQGRNLSYNMGTTFRKAIQHLQYANQHVQFKTNDKITTFFQDDTAAMITYDSGADRHYISKKDREKA